MASNFTPQQIEEFLQEFFDVVGARQYVGARYVPIFGRAGSDTVEWDDLAPYEPLTVVMHDGVSYVSRRYVPAGIEISDTDYWVETYRFNAQVEQYRQEVLGFQDQIDSIRQTMEDDYVPFPDPLVYPKYGTLGQVLSTLADGTVKWENPVVPSDEQAEEVITAWLDEHPEATTTIQDNSIEYQKIRTGFLPKIFNQELDGNTYASAGEVAANSYVAYTPTAGHQWADLPNPARYGELFTFSPTINGLNPIAAHAYTCQLFFQRVGSIEHMYYRVYYNPNSTWSDWVDLYAIDNDRLPIISLDKIPTLPASKIQNASLTYAQVKTGTILKNLAYATMYDSDTFTSAADVPPNSLVAYAGTAGKTWADLPNPNRFGFLVSLNGQVYSASTTASMAFGSQIFFQRVGSIEHAYYRTYYNPDGTWSPWVDLYTFDESRFTGTLSPGKVQQYTDLLPIYTLSKLFPLSSTQHKIALFGDSVTQGTGSTGQISYTKVIDGVNYIVRGNGPDYPDAGAGYQTGKYLGRNDTSHRIWYQEIDGNGWAQLLTRYLTSTYANVSVLNCGMAGATSQDLIDNIPSIIEGEGITYAIVMIGTNDRSQGSLGQTIYPHLGTIVDTLKSAGINVLLMTPIPASNTNETNNSQRFHMNQVAAAYTRVAGEKHVMLFDLYSRVLDYIDYTGSSIDAFLPDGLHPNDASHKILFDIISEAIGLPRKINGATW